MSVKIANRYAKALYSKAAETGKTVEVANDMQNLVSTAQENSEFRLFLESPVIHKSEKKAALKQIFSSCNEDSLNLFLLMTDKNREILLPDMAKELIRIYNINNGITEAEVISAVGLDDKTIAQISDFVKSQTSAKTVNISVTVDQNLVGGMKILFEGKLYDNSISTQINNLKKELNIA